MKIRMLDPYKDEKIGKFLWTVGTVMEMKDDKVFVKAINDWYPLPECFLTEYGRRKMWEVVGE